MKIVFTLVTILLFSIQGIGHEIKYPAASIPDSLKKNADAVIREYTVINTVISESKHTIYEKTVITILNANGAKHGYFFAYYDKLRKISKLNATVFDANGVMVKRLKQNEIGDQSYSDGTLFTDNRLKIVDLRQTKIAYPYTIEYEVESIVSYLYNLESFHPIDEERLSLEEGTYRLVFPTKLKPRFKVLNIKNTEPSKAVNGDIVSLEWKINHFVSRKPEPFSEEDLWYPVIYAAPTIFEYDGFKGNMETWSDYGKWISALNNERNILPEATQKKVKDITSGLTSIEQKAKVLYEHMQNKTRYVYIENGIGALQPFPASIVDELGYGDCKALSNYMVALLQQAGIKAYYATVQAGDYDTKIYEDFPSHQSNHVIVAVPNVKDTLWLECTNQVIPFAYQGKFTSDRKALLITENGGVLVNTTQYSTEENLQIRKADVHLELNGNATAQVQTKYKGHQYENGALDFIVHESHDKQKKWVEKTTSIPRFDVNSFSISSDKKRFPTANVNLDLVLSGFASVSAKRLFVNPNLMNRIEFIPEKIVDRKTPVLLKAGGIDLDTIIYHFPESIFPESLPDTITFSNRYGEYEAKFSASNGMLIYTRRIRINNGTFPADTYSEMVDFYTKVSKADKTKVVFLNKT